jgi:hypothetical protein
MKTRCLCRTNSHWPNYGGRGIRICKRWQGEHGFENFLTDMGPRPEGKTLDRKNVDGNYTKRNCRWATPQEQALNRRNNVKDIAAEAGIM